MNRTKSFLLTVSMVLATAFTFSCLSGDDDGGGNSTKGSFTDSRDGQSYGTVTIGGKTWMAKNLNFNASGSVCYDNQNSYCNDYGRLYNWEAAKSACPNGWHLPSDAEWSTLANSVGGSTAGRHLKATSGWYSNGNGLDTYGFSALPGGNGYSGGYFDYVGRHGYWWSATEYGGNDACLRGMYYFLENADNYCSEKDDMFSVRCLQD